MTSCLLTLRTKTSQNEVTLKGKFCSNEMTQHLYMRNNENDRDASPVSVPFTFRVDRG